MEYYPPQTDNIEFELNEEYQTPENNEIDFDLTTEVVESTSAAIIGATSSFSTATVEATTSSTSSTIVSTSTQTTSTSQSQTFAQSSTTVATSIFNTAQRFITEVATGYTISADSSSTIGFGSSGLKPSSIHSTASTETTNPSIISSDSAGLPDFFFSLVLDTYQGHTRDGTVQWETTAGSSGRVDDFVIDDGFDLYTVNGSKFLSVDQSGDIQWEFFTDRGSYDGIAVGTDRVCATLDDGNTSSFIEIDKETGDFTEHLGEGDPEARDGAMDKHGNYYQASTLRDRVTKISSAGTEEWFTEVDSVRSVIVGPNSEYVYCGASGDSLVQLDVTDGSIVETRTFDSNLNIEYVNDDNVFYGYGAYDWDDDEVLWDYSDDSTGWNQAQPTPTGKAYASSSTFNDADDRLIRVYDALSGELDEIITIETSDDTSRNNIAVMPDIGAFPDSWDIFETTAHPAVTQSSAVSTPYTSTLLGGRTGVASGLHKTTVTTTAGGTSTTQATSPTTQAISSTTTPSKYATTFSTASTTTTQSSSTQSVGNSGLDVGAEYVTSTTTLLLPEILENIIRAVKARAFSSTRTPITESGATTSAKTKTVESTQSVGDIFASSTIAALDGSIESVLKEIEAIGTTQSIATGNTATTSTTIADTVSMLDLSADSLSSTSSTTTSSIYAESYPQASVLDVSGSLLDIDTDALAGSTASPILVTTSPRVGIQFISRDVLVGEQPNGVQFTGRTGNSKSSTKLDRIRSN